MSSTCHHFTWCHADHPFDDPDPAVHESYWVEVDGLPYPNGHTPQARAAVTYSDGDREPTLLILMNEALLGARAMVEFTAGLVDLQPVMMQARAEVAQRPQLAGVA
ncbi:hypothetical protein AB0F72_08770 [Actinoplanes sp. NPDC023936]|uniref:hypothetical protein n=1 Tax=Actinoplanes sp. NPDC023936 TaxID=3154910 RepID=UPI0033FFAE50